MVKVFIKIAFLIICTIAAYSQEIIIERADVDTTRRSFVTATMNFRVKVKLYDVTNCTGISFVLRHNQADYVKFSNFKPSLFSKDGSCFVYPWVNPIDGIARIYTGILNGDTIGGKGADNPEAIEFEFSVDPNAPNGGIVEFSFEDAEAVITKNNIGEIIKLKNQPYLFDIHGFVNVWPGDANNDGIVNINDVSVVGLYLGYGAKKSNFRSFKRLEASTKWFPQSCLAWDSLAITYADCDGDGEITINDMLVIPLNFGKTQSRNNEFPNEHSLISAAQPQSNENNTNCSIPLKLSANEEIVAFASEVEFVANFSKVNAFGNRIENYNESFLFIKSIENRTELAIGSVNNLSLNGRIVCFSNSSEPINGKGITPEGKIIDAMLVPQIPLNVEEVINFSNEWGNPVSFELFNVLGATICKGFLNCVEQISTITNNLSNGLYLLQLTNPKGITKTLKIIVNN